MFGRFIIECDLDNIIFAGRAAEALAEYPDSKDIVVTFDGVTMYAKRNQRSIGVRQVKP